jgi:nucleotide-binding universal stress UspA family protein
MGLREVPNHRIVVGIDNSKSSAATLEWAATQAALSKATLEALTVWDWPASSDVFSIGVFASAIPAGYDPDEELAAALREVLETAQRNHPELVLHSVIVQGNAGRLLVEASHRAELLVVGTHGSSELSGLLLGSVSEYCVHHAACPVVVVRGAN